jgi:hypothetical protein
MDVLRFIALALIVPAFALATALAQEQPFGIVPHPDNTSHIDPGIALSRETSPFYPSRASTGGLLVKSSQFELPEVCSGCHQDAYTQWKGSMHSQAWTDPVYRAALNLMSEASKGKVDQFCMGCHTPIGVVTQEASPSGKGMSEVANQGVQCEVCHNISRSNGIGNGAYVLTPQLHGRPLKFGPYKDAASPYHDTAYSQLHTQSEFCGQCHDVTHPFNRLPLERTYSEWRDSSYAGQGVQCQDCHMKSSPGRASPLGPDRTRVATHYFVGGNVLVTKLLGSEVHAARAEEMLRSAATVKITAPASLSRTQPNSIRVRVTNVGAGHKLPTGFPEGREMWLDFKVLDAQGKVLYRSGAVRDGHTEKGTKSFKVILGDAKGNVVDVNILDADRILVDTRIEPHGYRDVEYNFEIPAGTEGPIRLAADLNYWSFSQELLDHLLGKDAPRAVITRMAEAETTVSVQ